MKKSSRGTTFIELLIVMVIVAIFSGFLLLNWRAGQKQYILQMAAIKLTQDVRRVEQFSASTKEFNGQVPLGGYGLYFAAATNHYVLFADIKNPGVYNPPCSPKCPVEDGLVEDIQLESGVQISQILPSSPLTITFLPPDPTVKISTGYNSVQIVLALTTDPTKIQTVTINKLGLVYIETQ
jgi:prepilin-type N-terminal cleavage/methylation domain-containing protein